MDKETLAKINSFTRREFTAKELYAFPVTLCDNNIDRDGEAFSDEALETLKGLFVGKTGIFDHDPKGENQSARIYDTEVVADSEKLTAYGTPYKYLKGMAYMVRTEKNKSLIEEIDAGIKKEVSISCSAEKKLCSICGSVSGGCEHIKGKEYDGKICYHSLEGITDAYEWSFVAVPAQVNAGVTKKYDKAEKEEKKMDEKFRQIGSQEELDKLVAAAVGEAVKKYEGWISPEEHQKQLDAVTAEKKSFEIKCLKLNAAISTGLPVELAGKISGDTEEAILKDAEAFAALTVKAAQQVRHFSPEGGVMSGVEKAFYDKNPELKH